MNTNKGAPFERTLVMVRPEMNPCINNIQVVIGTIILLPLYEIRLRIPIKFLRLMTFARMPYEHLPICQGLFLLFSPAPDSIIGSSERLVRKPPYMRVSI